MMGKTALDEGSVARFMMVVDKVQLSTMLVAIQQAQPIWDFKLQYTGNLNKALTGGLTGSQWALICPTGPLDITTNTTSMISMYHDDIELRKLLLSRIDRSRLASLIAGRSIARGLH